MVVSASRLPDVRVHGGTEDFKAVGPGKVAYCLASRPLGDAGEDRAKTALLELAYAFHDWFAREVVAAHRRKIRHGLLEHLDRLRHAPAPTPARVLVHLGTAGRLPASELADELGLAQPHLSRASKSLVDVGLVRSVRSGRNVILEPVKERLDALRFLDGS